MLTTSSQLFEYFSRLFTPEVQYLCKNVLILFHDFYRKINSLPLKYSFATKVCCVCGENKKEVRSIESEKGKERKLSQLLLKYGDLNLVQGIFTAYRKRLFPVKGKNERKNGNKIKIKKS
jgi:hypothetical protein